MVHVILINIENIMKLNMEQKVFSELQLTVLKNYYSKVIAIQIYPVIMVKD